MRRNKYSSTPRFRTVITTTKPNPKIQTLGGFAFDLFAIPVGFNLSQAFRVPGLCVVANMNDSKLFVFGSFTEDEARSLLQSQSSGSVKKPVSYGRKTGELGEDKGLHVGSLNFETERSLSGANGEPKRQLGIANGTVFFQLSAPLWKDDKDKTRTASNDHLLGNLGSSKENGHIRNSTDGSVLSIGVKDLKADGIDLTLLRSLQKDIGDIHSSPSLKFHILDAGSFETKDQNGTTSISGPKEGTKKTIKEPVKSIKDLLHRGLLTWGICAFLIRLCRLCCLVPLSFSSWRNLEGMTSPRLDIQH